MKGWTLEKEEKLFEGAPFETTIRTYYRKGLRMIVSPVGSDRSRTQVSLSRSDGAHPTTKEMRRVKECFPPGAWKDIACSDRVHHWEYTPDGG